LEALAEARRPWWRKLIGLTEEEARELLRQCDGLGGLEAWIARQS
jgi:hypothetical protein